MQRKDEGDAALITGHHLMPSTPETKRFSASSELNDNAWAMVWEDLIERVVGGVRCYALQID